MNSSYFKKLKKETDCKISSEWLLFSKMFPNIESQMIEDFRVFDFTNENDKKN